MLRRAIAGRGALLKARLLVLELQLREVVQVPIHAQGPGARSSGRFGGICKAGGESCRVHIERGVTSDEFPGANAPVAVNLKALARDYAPVRFLLSSKHP